MSKVALINGIDLTVEFDIGSPDTYYEAVEKYGK